GPGAQQLADREHEFRSNERHVTRIIHGTPTEVTVNYPRIDEGRTRFEENEARKLRNWVREQEELALNGHDHREGIPVMDRIAIAAYRLDARYREAVNGALPADDGDPINTAIREHLAAREERAIGQRQGNQPPLHGEVPPPINGYGSGGEY